MRIQGEKLPRFSKYVEEIGVNKDIARAYQKTLSQVKAMEARFEKLTASKFGGPGMRFAEPKSIYQMSFAKYQTPENRNEYIMKELIELKQMQTFRGLAGMHQEKLDNYMTNVAEGMEKEGYSPEQVQKFMNKYLEAKELDRQDYIHGRSPEFRAWEFVSLTGGKSISLRYMSVSADKTAEEVAELQNDISDFIGAINAYLGK